MAHLLGMARRGIANFPPPRHNENAKQMASRSLVCGCDGCPANNFASHTLLRTYVACLVMHPAMCVARLLWLFSRELAPLESACAFEATWPFGMRGGPNQHPCQKTRPQPRPTPATCPFFWRVIAMYFTGS